MKVLVTGATGFLGSHLVKVLVREGHYVVVIKRSFSDINRLSDILPQLHTYDIDFCDLVQPFRDHGKFDAVIHTATSYGREGENAPEIFEANVAFPLRLLQTSHFFDTETFFNTDTRLCKFLNPYSLSKKQFGEWGRLFAVQKNIRFINIELEHFYGPGDDDAKFTAWVIKSCLQDVNELNLTAGEQKRDFIYIDDVVSAYLILLEKGPQLSSLFQNYSLGSGHSVSVRELVEMVRHITRSRTKLNFGAIPYREHEVMESCADTTDLNALGWFAGVSLEDGIRRTIEYEKSIN